MIRSIAYEGAARVGLNRIARKLLEARPLVLCFHGICDEAPNVADREGQHVPRRRFEGQLEALLKHYSPVSLEQLRKALLEGNRLPACPLLVTFDDGYRNVARHALPLLRKLGIPCAWFVVPGAIESGQWLWPCEIEHRWGHLEDFGARMRHLQSLPAVTRRESLAALEGQRNRPEDCEYTLATWDELSREVASGGVEVGSHGLGHEPLETCEPVELRRELALSADLIEKRLGVRPAAIAYPSGTYSRHVVEATRQLGYLIGFTTKARHVREGDDALALPRILVGARDNPSILLARSAGWMDRLRAFR